MKADDKIIVLIKIHLVFEVNEFTLIIKKALFQEKASRSFELEDKLFYVWKWKTLGIFWLIFFYYLVLFLEIS